MLKAILDTIIVKPISQETQTKSGIIIALQKDKYPNRGKIISIGKDVKCNLKVGDLVLFKKFEGVEMKDNGKMYLWVEEKNLLATYEKDTV